MTQEEQIYELKKENERLQNEIANLTDKCIDDFSSKTKLMCILSRIEVDLRTIINRL